MRHKKKTILLILICIILITQLLIIPTNVRASTYTQTLKQGIENFPEDYQAHLKKIQELYPNWNFTAYYTGLTWSEFMTGENSVHYTNSVIQSSNELWKCECKTLKSGYVCASRAITAHYADPRNFLGESTIFQFLEMSYNENIHTEQAVKGIIASSFMDTEINFELNGKQTTMSYSAIIMEAAKQSGISPYSIAIKIFQEVGRDGSGSVSGKYIAVDGTDYSGYYNFFNYGANDEGNAIENGLKYAKEKGWNNQYKAIIDGAKLMANSYINAGQNTAYFYKWDVVGNKWSNFFNHQYMTNVQDPTSQSSSLFNTYAKNDLLDKSLNFIIPIYGDMPAVNTLPTSIDVTSSTSYYVTGTDVRIRQNPSTSSSILAYPTKNEVLTLLEWNSASANGYEWAKVKTANGTVGYIANKYLSPCNPINDDENNNENNNGNNTEDQKPVNNNAKIEGANIKIVPNLTGKDIATIFNITDYEILKGETKIENTTNIGTGYTFLDKTNNKNYTIIMLGDANEDGRMTPADSTALLRAYVGLSEMSDVQKTAIDVNKDGKVTPADSTVVLRAYVGLESISL